MLPFWSELHFSGCDLYEFPHLVPFVNVTSLLVIDLSFNNFNTTLPGWLFNISTLTDLYLIEARIKGPIPHVSLRSLCNLVTLDLSFNNIGSEGIELVNGLSICSNNSLEGLYLGGNEFSGPIPTWIGNLLRMKRLGLSFNLMNGTIPESIGQLRELTVLYLDWNSWEGVISEIHFSPIPLNIGESSSLTVLDVSGNLLNGSIPSSISKLKYLGVINLSNNHLSGKIPKNWNDLHVLWTIDLSKNKLSGGIPSWMSSKSSLERLILGDNNLSGEPFPSLRNCTGLSSLDLGNNRFSGSIPQCLGKLIALSSVTLLEFDDNPESHFFYSERMELVVKGQDMEFDSILPIVNLIDLSSNNIWGEIPEEITNLSTLGPIPTTNQFSTFNDPSIYEANLGLCGPPLSTNCSTLNDQDHTDEEDDEDEWDLSWFFISMGLGFPVGFWAVCGSLALKKSWRQTYFRFIDETRDRLYVFTAVNVARLKRKMEANGVHG
ncbi:LRR receptor-like serine/threonine-protein kinase FLS2 [Vitis vinifera]|uniref:LRR receptor-like serine/threonine-protein kinase FLS2 n=1 Tax=Vitis vinifera TaxID=29760 RepID=A0A438IRB1_VITVI|nr:LRR receptor-like serine/threonine-protein kinase FLS2 [Vitis vinifera]